MHGDGAPKSRNYSVFRVTVVSRSECGGVIRVFPFCDNSLSHVLVGFVTKIFGACVLQTRAVFTGPLKKFNRLEDLNRSALLLFQ